MTNYDFQKLHSSSFKTLKIRVSPPIHTKYVEYLPPALVTHFYLYSPILEMHTSLVQVQYLNLHSHTYESF